MTLPIPSDIRQFLSMLDEHHVEYEIIGCIRNPAARHDDRGQSTDRARTTARRRAADDHQQRIAF